MKTTTEKEQEWHNERFSQDIDPRRRVDKYYRVVSNAEKYINQLLKKYTSFNDSVRLLEYGCGSGENLERHMKLNGIDIYGIDISEEGIKKAIKKSDTLKINANYFVMDAEKTTFENSFFDIVIGNGIVHHLNIENSMLELSRILKKDGHALFFEPLGHNPIINLYRKFTPELRTDDEHPIVMDDLNKMKRYFQVNTKYFCLTSIASVLFIGNTFIFNHVHNFLEKIDSVLLHIFPSLKKYAWIVVIDLKKVKV